MFELIPFNRKRKDLMNPFESFLDEVLNGFNHVNSDFKSDIKETNSEFVIEAELPGITKDNINIEFEEGYLSISASNDESVDEDGENYIRRERKIGKFERKFMVDSNKIKENKITANYENGILKVILPKNDPPKKKSKSINIK